MSKIIDASNRFTAGNVDMDEGIPVPKFTLKSAVYSRDNIIEFFMCGRCDDIMDLDGSVITCPDCGDSHDLQDYET